MLTRPTLRRFASAVWPETSNASHAVWRRPLDSAIVTLGVRSSSTLQTASVIRGSVFDISHLSGTAVQRFGLTMTFAPGLTILSHSQRSIHSRTRSATAPSFTLRRITFDLEFI